MAKPALVLVGIDYALKSYMQYHAEALQYKFNVHYFALDSLPVYTRKSVSTLLIELYYAFQHLRALRPVVLVSVGPKPGLISTILSLLLRCRHVHWFTGQQWCLDKIKLLSISYLSDCIINALSAYSLCDSPAQARYLYANLPPFIRKPILSTRDGSISPVDPLLYGLNLDRNFKSGSILFKDRSLTIGFLGRICSDKGLDTLYRVASKFSCCPQFKFLICGPLDSSLALSSADHFTDAQVSSLKGLPNVTVVTGYVDKSLFFSAIDIFIMPSKREGFCLAVVEAQAAGIPVVCSNIYGLTDSAIHMYGSVKCDSVSDYCDWIQLLSNKYIYSLFAVASRSVSSRYSVAIFRSSLHDVYQCILR